MDTANTPAISTVKTKLINVFATRFLTDLEADTLMEFPHQKLKVAVTYHKIVTERKRFSSLQVTAECEDLTVMYDPEIWPTGAYVRMYYEPRRSKGANHVDQRAVRITAIVSNEVTASAKVNYVCMFSKCF